MKSLTFWLTGLSGAGKSTFAQAFKHKLVEQLLPCVILDGDILREGVCNDLGYTPKERTENNRRVAEIAKILNDEGIHVICALISPFEKDRKSAKCIIGQERFKEVYLNAPLEVCERRDPKGLYLKARNCEITNFTGVSAAYEAPLNPDLTIIPSWSPQEAAQFAYQRFIATEIDA